MYADDLFKKLKPILGDRINQLQAVYFAGDDEDKRNVERILRVIYANVVAGIHPPSYKTSDGKYTLGMVLSGEKMLYPFSLNDEDWFHIGIFGQTGRGKTRLMLHLLQILKKHNIPWLVFDWKRTGYRDLLTKHNDILVFTVGRDVSPFCINPLIPPPDVDDIMWYKQFIQCISHAYFLGHGCEVILQDIIGKETVTLVDLYKKLNMYPAKWRKLQWLQSTERAIKALCYGGISNVLNATNSLPISHWLDKNIIFELDALTESEAKFFVNIIMSQIFLYRKEHNHNGFRHVSVIEEAHNVLKREPDNVEAKSVMDKVFREIREYGESMIIIDQMPSTIMDSAIANTATQITFSLKHSDDVRSAGNAMLLDRDDQSFLGRLPVGTALVKLQNRWHAAFLVSMPYIKMETGKVTDGIISESMKRLLSSNANQKNITTGKRDDICGCSGQNRAEQLAFIENRENSPVLKRDKDSKKPEGELSLLIDIMENPLSPIRERYKRLNVSAYIGDRYQKSLLSSGFIKPVRITAGKRVIKLFKFTDEGKGKLKEIGYDVSGSLRHGGVEHLYWVHQAKKKLENAGHKVHEEYPIGNGETVDLAIITKSKKIAVEIETGKSDAIHNIRKCLDAGFEVVSLAVNEKVLESIKTSLGHFTEDEIKKIRLKFGC